MGDFAQRPVAAAAHAGVRVDDADFDAGTVHELICSSVAYWRCSSVDRCLGKAAIQGPE
jgi:hypothetical protein